MRQRLSLVIGALLVMVVGALAGTPTLRSRVTPASGDAATRVAQQDDAEGAPQNREAPDAGGQQSHDEFLVLPYVAVGGSPEGWHFLTVVSLENVRNSAVSGQFAFFNNEGNPMHVQMNDGAEVVSASDWTLEPKESKVIVISHSGNQFEAGWIRVNLANHAKVDLVVLVQFYNGTNLIGQAGAMAGSGQRRLASYKLISSEAGNAISLLKEPSRIPRFNVQKFSASARASSAAKKYTVAEMGLASWYGFPYHGRKAADGSVYNKYKLTAAHRTLPFGTRARVTNLRTHRSVTVRITDRGPFVPGRVVDLSKVAAMEIGMLKDGVAPVLVEVLLS